MSITLNKGGVGLEWNTDGKAVYFITFSFSTLILVGVGL